jgi:hypothetical protein
MGLFNFVLRPTAEIQPWGEPGRHTLSWFGLSDGWYWLNLGGQELFRVREPEVAAAPPYADYQIVRLWEDLLDLVPAVLEPIPVDLAQQLRTPERFLATVERLQEDDLADENSMGIRVREGLAFWHARHLDSGHLVAAPHLWFWRDDATVHALWHSSPRGAELWQPAAGSLSMPVDQFVSELCAFDQAFITAMGERVQSLQHGGGLAGVRIDLDQLAAEQRDRATWLERALSRTLTEDWGPARQVLAPHQTEERAK